MIVCVCVCVLYAWFLCHHCMCVRVYACVCDRESDFVFARTGFPLEYCLSHFNKTHTHGGDDSSSSVYPTRFRAKLRTWTDGTELLALFKEVNITT